MDASLSVIWSRGKEKEEEEEEEEEREAWLSEMVALDIHCCL